MNFRGLPLLLGLLSVAGESILAQGQLTPSGTPAPTMKTLDQVEARTPIDASHTQGDGSNQFIVSASGSYYLTANVSGTSGKNGIMIAADNVTVDLNGFGLLGASGSLNGIVVSGAHKNVVITNGNAQGWGGSGIDAGSGSNAQLYNLQLSSNGASGLVVGSSTFAHNCVAWTNGGEGLRVIGTASRIEDNNSSGNAGAGIKVDTPGNLIIKNNATSNGASDYNIVAGSSYGQIVATPGANFTSATAWANFSSSCPGGQVFCAGVCADVSSNPNNCGSCGNVCTVANGTPGCASGNCTIAGCNAGFANCDNQIANGCEVNLTNDPNHCGGCGTVCANVANGTKGCTNSACVIASCSSGFANCNNVYADGCEINTNTDVSNCGACGNACSTNNATAGCAGAACFVVSCNAGFANCNNSAADGCEVNLGNNVANCGGCGIVCSSNNITATCAGSQCNGTCASGFLDCNGNKQTDGCEVNKNTDANNCGSCGHVCPGVHICTGGNCQ